MEKVVEIKKVNDEGMVKEFYSFNYSEVVNLNVIVGDKSLEIQIQTKHQNELQTIPVEVTDEKNVTSIVYFFESLSKTLPEKWAEGPRRLKLKNGEKV